MTNSTLSKKLHIKEGQRLTIINPPEGYMSFLGELPEGVELEKHAKGEFDFVHLFVNNIAELEESGPEALDAVKYDGILWVSYPKKSSGVSTDISRDVGWDIMAKNGLRAVAAVSIDDVWSALRFRPVERVKTNK
ncbi:MAG: hypothetical protein PVH84_15890 [Candidatus Aminicenantes bacterium]|jgi:hypothetical protein